MKQKGRCPRLLETKNLSQKKRRGKCPRLLELVGQNIMNGLKSKIKCMGELYDE